MRASLGLIFHFSHSSDLSWVPSGLFHWAGLWKKGKHVVPAVLGPQFDPGSKPGSQVGAAACSPLPAPSPVTGACEPCRFGVSGSLWMLSQV